MNLMQKILTLLLITSMPAYCLDTTAESQQKAKLIRYLVSKVSWPDSSFKNNKFTICVVGEQERINPINKLNGQMVNNHKLIVSPFQQKHRLQECNLIYLANKNTAEQKEIVSHYKKHPVLLISDNEHFANLGGSMNFVIIGEQIALTINLDSMKKSRLVMDIQELEQVILVPEEKDLK